MPEQIRWYAYKRREKMNLMMKAVEIAKLSGGDVPVGCVIENGGEIIATEYNRCEATNDVTAHAEILALQSAQKKLGGCRLDNCKMYVTLEPCPMCGWAIIQSGIKYLYFGSYNTQYGAMESILNLPRLANSKIKVYGGIEEEICNRILEDFFRRLRLRL